VTRLVIDRGGAVVGVEVNHLPPDSDAYRRHEQGYRRFQKFLRFSTSKGVAAIKEYEALERSAGRRKLIRARNGVILCNRQLRVQPGDGATLRAGLLRRRARGQRRLRRQWYAPGSDGRWGPRPDECRLRLALD